MFSVGVLVPAMKYCVANRVSWLLFYSTLMLWTVRLAGAVPLPCLRPVQSGQFCLRRPWRVRDKGSPRQTFSFQIETALWFRLAFFHWDVFRCGVVNNHGTLLVSFMHLCRPSSPWIQFYLLTSFAPGESEMAKFRARMRISKTLGSCPASGKDFQDHYRDSSSGTSRS